MILRNSKLKIWKNDLLSNTKNGGGDSNGWESEPRNLHS